MSELQDWDCVGGARWGGSGMKDIFLGGYIIVGKYFNWACPNLVDTINV